MCRNSNLYNYYKQSFQNKLLFLYLFKLHSSFPFTLFLYCHSKLPADMFQTLLCSSRHIICRMLPSIVVNVKKQKLDYNQIIYRKIHLIKVSGQFFSSSMKLIKNHMMYCTIQNFTIFQIKKNPPIWRGLAKTDKCIDVIANEKEFMTAILQSS